MYENSTLPHYMTANMFSVPSQIRSEVFSVHYLISPHDNPVTQPHPKEPCVHNPCSSSLVTADSRASQEAHSNHYQRHHLRNAEHFAKTLTKTSKLHLYQNLRKRSEYPRFANENKGTGRRNNLRPHHIRPILKSMLYSVDILTNS